MSNRIYTNDLARLHLEQERRSLDEKRERFQNEGTEAFFLTTHAYEEGYPEIDPEDDPPRTTALERTVGIAGVNVALTDARIREIDNQIFRMNYADYLLDKPTTQHLEETS